MIHPSLLTGAPPWTLVVLLCVSRHCEWCTTSPTLLAWRFQVVWCPAANLGAWVFRNSQGGDFVLFYPDWVPGQRSIIVVSLVRFYFSDLLIECVISWNSHVCVRIATLNELCLLSWHTCLLNPRLWARRGNRILQGYLQVSFSLSPVLYAF